MKMAPNTQDVNHGAAAASATAAASAANLGTTAASSGGHDRSMPKDGKVMTAILKDMGILEYEPRVVHQMLEFAYRYITTILEDARTFSNHARKKAVDLDDVKLAVAMNADHNVTTPPTRDVLLEVAARKNAAPLPVPKMTGGLHLPPDRFTLTSCNYQLKVPTTKRGRAAHAPYPPPSGSSGGGKGVKNAAQPQVTKPAALKINNTTVINAASAVKTTAAASAAPLFSMTVSPAVGGAGHGDAIKKESLP